MKNKDNGLVLKTSQADSMTLTGPIYVRIIYQDKGIWENSNKEFTQFIKGYV